MAAASSSAPFFGIIRDQDRYNTTQQQPGSSAAATEAAAASQPAAPPKKKRNQAGNPNPDAEVIALSPRALLATNRFVCEVCNKGFQREQNLQLHRRGHNLPWKLKQKNPKEVRRRVYVCPEPTCVHHEPSRALGDLTGIKKHFCRKHGEKKWKCDKCSKRYAVQSDWKAHSKTCGTREYRCDCGTLFSRRDSFITHRAFCDALAQETARFPSNISTLLYGAGNSNAVINLGQQLPQVNSSQLSSLQDHAQFGHLPMPHHYQPSSSSFFLAGGAGGGSTQDFNQDRNTQQLQCKPLIHGGLMPLHDHLQTNPNPSSSSSSSSSSSAAAAASSNLFNLNIFSNRHAILNSQFNEPGATTASTLFAGNLMSNDHMIDMSMYNESSMLAAHMSATALLQKAAQMGATSSSGGGSASSLLRGFGGSYSGEAMNSGVFGFGQESGFGGRGSEMSESCRLQRSNISTRDFLGVGNMMRSMRAGGMTQQRRRQQQQQQQQLVIDMDSFDSELKSGSSARSFIGGGLQ